MKRTHDDHRKRAATAALASLLLALPACGGGGGTGSTSAPSGGGSPPPPSGGGSTGARLHGNVTNAGALTGAAGAHAPAPGVAIEVLGASERVLGSASTDAAGGFDIASVPAGATKIRVSLPSAAVALPGGSSPRLTLEAKFGGNTDVQLVEALGLADLTGKGKPNAVLFSGTVKDASGDRVHLMALDPSTGTTTPDTNGDGDVDEQDTGFDDSNGDGIPDDEEGGTPVTAEVKAKGSIDSISSDSITVGGVTFAVTSSTVWLDATGTATVPSAFTTGDPVEVEGTRASDGSVTAVRVKMEEDNGGMGDQQVEVQGTIEAIDASSLSVRGVTFAVDASTQVTGHDGEPITFSDLAVGDFVEVHGQQSGSSVVAVKIHVEDLGGGDGSEVELRGTIDSIDATTITVGGQVFQTDDSTQYEGDQHSAISRSDLAAGDVVEIDAVRDASGNLIAQKVKLETGGGDEGGGGSGGNGDGEGGGGDNGGSGGGDHGGGGGSDGGFGGGGGDGGSGGIGGGDGGGGGHDGGGGGSGGNDGGGGGSGGGDGGGGGGGHGGGDGGGDGGGGGSGGGGGDGGGDGGG